MPIIIGMTGITISEMAEILRIPKNTVKRRLIRAGCKPFSLEAMYTKEDFDAIRNVPGKGRPPKPKPEAKPVAAPKAKARKTAKKD